MPIQVMNNTKYSLSIKRDMIIRELINCNNIYHLQITQEKTLKQQLQELDFAKNSDLSKKKIARL